MKDGPVHWGNVIVPWLLLFGGLAYGVGWLLGVALLWLSPVWSLRDRILGTAVFPGGVLGLWAFRMLTGSPITLAVPRPLGYAMIGTYIAAPIAVAIHLNVVRQRAMALSLFTR